ncbi:MAG: spermidine/putrescine ABC transporter substrate-binding protein [Geminicoccaceae bacterium]|nr:spermidine/putrescine ABC transporter substrate-binding protein [Geminicoccaceae bacterium]
MARRPTPSPFAALTARGLAARGLTRREALGAGLAVAATAGALPRLGAAQDNQVNVYNWDTYIGETTIADFTERTGIEVRYDLFASNDELFAKLREGNPGYDVIYPSNDWVSRMVAADMLVPLDHAKIPNMANIDPLFADPAFDPGRTYSMPYMWGTLGIGFRSTVGRPSKWADMFEDDLWAGKMSFLADAHSIYAGLKYLGYSLNSDDPAEIQAVVDAFVAAKSKIKTFAPDTGQDLLISGEVDCCLEWSGDIQQVMAEDDELDYVVPEEGSMLWEDTMAIPTGAPHVEAAHAWIDYILDAQVHGAIAEEIKFACPNAAAMQYIPEEDRENPTIYPSRSVLERCEIRVYQSEEVSRLYQDALTKILAA